MEEKQKIIERVEDVIEIFSVGAAIAADKELKWNKEHFGKNSLKYNITWTWMHLTFGDYYPIQIYFYDIDNSLEIIICEKAFNFNIDEDERFNKYKKSITRGPRPPGMRNIAIIPKNTKQIQEIFQKLIKYM